MNIYQIIEIILMILIIICSIELIIVEVRKEYEKTKKSKLRRYKNKIKRLEETMQDVAVMFIMQDKFYKTDCEWYLIEAQKLEDRIRASIDELNGIGKH